MSKSGQTSTKADNGGQRVPKSAAGDNTSNDKKSAPKRVPGKKDPAKKSGT